jgi:hypothetical protein
LRKITNIAIKIAAFTPKTMIILYMTGLATEGDGMLEIIILLLYGKVAVGGYLSAVIMLSLQTSPAFWLVTSLVFEKVALDFINAFERWPLVSFFFIR